jgi:hypothetical protein
LTATNIIKFYKIHLGGNLINITGFGFSGNSIVKIDGNICRLRTYTYTLIQCIVPQNVNYILCIRSCIHIHI